MKAYWILNYNITDPKVFETYRPAATPLIRNLVNDGKAKILVINDNLAPDKQEGNPGESLVVIEFISKEIAREFYYSAEYQKVLGLRTENSDGWSVIVNGLE